MSLLSSPLSQLKTHYDVIVIGSGYGGSISAARLARAAKADGSKVSVCLMERGREIPVGHFPDTLLKAAKEFQVDTKAGHLGNRKALFDMRQNDEINVLQGCGLGGTSLINANVSLRAEPWVWEDDAWPRAIRDDRSGGLEAGYARAKSMLQPIPYPNEPELAKNAMHRKSAEHLGHADCFYNPPVNVTFESGVNNAGIYQEACNGCGDCVSGCNVGAKNTLMRNYLPAARNSGAEIFCGVQVRRLARRGGKTVVYYEPVGADRRRFGGADLFVSADIVIVSAGTLGTAEILLRSKENGLTCSDELGARFTGNGDVLGFGYNTDHEINAIGSGDKQVDPAAPAGPCITSVIDLRGVYADPEDGFVIEEGSIPGALSPVLASALQTAAAVVGEDTDRGPWDSAKEMARVWQSAAPGGAYRGAVRNTQIYLIMAHDDGAGKLELKGDRVRVDWPGLGKQEVFQRTNDVLFSVTEALGGTYTPSPFFTKAFGYDLVTVHPLGGACMGEDAGSGVVNHKGQLFAGGAGNAVYEDIYVADGSVIPRPLGVNPLLTISALAERNAYLLAADRDWTIDESRPESPAKLDGSWSPDDKLTLQFTERMTGHCSTSILSGYRDAEEDGRAKGQECSFLLTIRSDDLEQMIDDDSHEATIIGTVDCPALSSDALTVSSGRFNLFKEDESEEGLKRMIYRFNLVSVEGAHYFFDGFKLIKDERGPDLWSDTTTLYITIHHGEDDRGPVAAKGILHIAKEDFATQMRTVESRTSDGKRSFEGTAKLGAFFFRELWDTYGLESLGADSAG